ncbi:leucine-rich repeat protein [Faecalibacterium duncaniae]|uniref:leucine-rich repeat protein n=1 Tax=Faecalibacterium duncaniae (strain DSM 17677 / JCM 31915 / A2-165) TaxID=411483 RepID=UPI0029411A68|nr:leucine-rich repeat protein [Faecalibacterium duncaniae]MDV5041672.1 leucine-rich repeat protein [Faecalibacterium duncaniae]
MRPKRLISLLVAVCMMITMLPLSAVTAFAEDTSSSTGGTASDGTDTYKYEYTVNDGNATITKFLGPVGSANPNFYDIKIPSELGGHPVTGLGEYSFAANPYDGHQGNPLCSKIRSVTIPQSVTSIGKRAFDGCSALTTLSLGEKIKTIGNYAFENCTSLTGVTIPQSVTSIGYYAFEGCTNLNPLTIKGPITSMGNYAFAGSTYLTSLTLYDDIQTIGNFAFLGSTSLKTVTLPKNLTSIGEYAFACCSELESITIPENVKTINPKTFADCSKLEYIILPAGLTTFDDSLENCRPECVIYYKDYKTAADALRDNNVVLQNDILAGHNFLYLCKVTFDANGGDLTGKGGNLTNYLTDNLTDHAEVPVYKTEKITDTKANDLKETDLDAINAPKRTGYKFTGWYTEDGKLENGKLFNVKDTAITDDITLYAGWKFDPDALDCHQLTVTGGTVTVKYDGSDVTNTLTVTPGATTGQKTYDVPQGATVTVTLDKTAVPNGKVFDGWSTTGNLSLLTGQDYKAESITFRMSSGVNVSAKYRDAAADHTPATAVCHPLTVTGGIVTVKNGDKDVTDTLTVTTDETTGKKTYSVPDGAEVTVTLDKTLIPEGMVFDIWSTGKFSLPLGQDYKAETITFTMNTMSSDADIAAQYRDASIEDDGPGVLGTAAIIGTAAVGTAVLGYQAYSLGAEFAGKLMALPYFPSNRSALAMMLWEDAGKPMPESELLYPDVEQEEQDMDLQHAARWAMENELIPDLNDEGTAPEEMKFFPANPVSKLDVLNAWQKAQELKNN